MNINNGFVLYFFTFHFGEKEMYIHKPQNIFDVATVIMVMKVIASLSSYVPYNDTVDTILSLVSTILYVYCILIDNYSMKTLLIYGVIGLLGLYSVIKTGNFGFLISILVCFAVRKRDLNHFISIVYDYELLFIVLHTLCAFILYGFGNITLQVFEKGMNRITFGFSNPNTFSVLVFNLILMWLWLNYKRLNRNHLVCIFITAGITVLFTKTRTMLIDCIVLLLLLSFSRKDRSIDVYKWMASICIPVLSISTWLFVIMYLKGSPIAYAIDSMLNARIKLGAYAYEHVGITALGQYMLDFRAVWDEVWRLNHFTFDNIYTYLTCNQGLIWLLIISVIFTKLSKAKNNLVNILIIVWALYGMTEVHGLNGFLCMPIFLCTYVFDNKLVDLYEFEGGNSL